MHTESPSCVKVIAFFQPSGSMADTTHHLPSHNHVRGLPISVLQRASLWLFVFSGCFALIEPSPYEVAFLICCGLFSITGIRIPTRHTPMIFMLLLFNMGGAFSLIPFMDEPRSVMFIVISFYLMFTTILFAALMSEDTFDRLATIRSAIIASAWVASIAGILGYFNVAGLGEAFTLYDRARGTFKDPNVFGPYLILPILFILEGLLSGRTSFAKTLFLVSVPLLGLLLSFSRGAWIHLVASAFLMFVLTYITSGRAVERARVILYIFVGISAIVILFMIALSIDKIRQLFEVRASLKQDYDLGVTGRFGNQLRSIPLLLESPNGFGPLRFRYEFGQDPHNVYINAFASYGWLGGLSYIALIALTWIVGWAAVFKRSPWQSSFIAIWATFFITTLQGIQIDTDHWRHFYLLLGLVWGLALLRPARS